MGGSVPERKSTELGGAAVGKPTHLGGAYFSAAFATMSLAMVAASSETE